jgi:hypothetical protein
VDPDPAVLTRWVHDDAGVVGPAADEPVTTGPVAASTPEDSGSPSKRFLILCGAVVLFVGFFGWRKLFA